jgi:hypothetical protein
MATEKPVPVSAPTPLVPTLKFQTPSEGPSSVKTPVTVAAASKQYDPGGSVTAASVPISVVQTSSGFGARAAYVLRKSLKAGVAASSPTLSCPVIGQPVCVTEPVGAATKVPTSPAMVPPVQLTAVLASTRKFDDAADRSPLERERCGAELMGPVGSLHAAESSAANVTRAVAANLG